MSKELERAYAVPTYRNTDHSSWWKMLNDECRKLGIADRTFGEAYDAYEVGETPATAAAQFAAMEGE